MDSFLNLDDDEAGYQSPPILRPPNQELPRNTSKSTPSSSARQDNTAGPSKSCIVLERIRPIDFLKNGELNWGVLVEEQERTKSQFVRDSVQKNAHYSMGSGQSSVRMRKDGNPVDAFGIELAAKLRAYNSNVGNSSSGGYRQIRHVGIPLNTKSDLCSEGKCLLAENTAKVTVLQ